MKGRGIFFNIKGAALGNSYKTSKNLRTSAPLALLFSIRTTVACDIPKLSPKSLVDKPSSRLNVLSSFPENVSSQRGSNIYQTAYNSLNTQDFLLKEFDPERRGKSLEIQNIVL